MGIRMLWINDSKRKLELMSNFTDEFPMTIDFTLLHLQLKHLFQFQDQYPN